MIGTEKKDVKQFLPKGRRRHQQKNGIRQAQRMNRRFLTWPEPLQIQTFCLGIPLNYKKEETEKERWLV
jgi:hypothetical protein